MSPTSKTVQIILSRLSASDHTKQRVVTEQSLNDLILGGVYERRAYLGFGI